MSETPKKSDLVDSTLDLQLGEILDEYLQQLEKGTVVSREELLCQHPDLAARLAACLDGVELFERTESTAVQDASDLEGSARGQEGSPQTIGDYEIRDEIGRGGMGVVYEALEKSLDRIVALKVMRFGIVDPRALERFQREAETAGALHHTNIVPVYATGREGDISWYAMQMIEGQSLAQRIHTAYDKSTSKPVTADEIVDVGLQAAEALHHAHERDVVHRDVKPANLIVDHEGRVWLTDFGLARRLVDVGATMTGALLGTPRYMSPEQADLARVDVDHRSDIYSLGATLYELATGRPPFEGDDPLRVISKIRYEDPPSPRSVRPGISRDLDVVLMKCLAKESDRRFSTAAELADDLRAIRDDRPIRARPTSVSEQLSRWARKHQGLVRTAGVAALATVLIGMLVSFGLETWREQNRASFRLRAAGGPYSTTIQPAGDSRKITKPIKLTVPIQSYEQLPHGDYDMVLSSRGRWSQKVRLPIRPGIDTEYRVRSQSPPLREISIRDAAAMPTAGFDGPAVIWSRDGVLKRYALDEKEDWSLPASEIETSVVSIVDLGAGIVTGADPRDVNVPTTAEVESTVVAEVEAEVAAEAEQTEDSVDSEEASNTLVVDFAISPAVDATPWLRAVFHQHPQIATPRRTLPSAIDLNADGRADTIVAAMGKSALLAVDADGNVLWAKAYDLNGRLRDGDPSTLPQPIQHLLPGIIDIHDVGDRNGDRVPELLVQMVHIQPGLQNDVCLALLDGGSGDVLKAMYPPPLRIKDYAAWPKDGQLTYQNGGEVRTTGTMRFLDYQTRLDNSIQHSKIAQRSGGTARFPVPSPLSIVQDTNTAAKQLFAIYAAGDNCRVYDVSTGELLGTPIQLGGLMVTRPKLVRLGQADEGPQWGLMFYEPHLNHTTKIGAINGARFSVYDLSGKLQWEQIRESPNWEKSTAYPAKVDWPLVADVDGDGRDEILIPNETKQWGASVVGGRWMHPSGLMLLDAATGKDRWKLEQPQRCGTTRIAVTTDIDGDGIRDFACASVFGPTPINLKVGESTEIGLADVYVDWLSSATGAPIAWAKHPVTSVP